MSYIQKNNFNYYKLFYLVKKARESLVVQVRKLLFKKYMNNHKIIFFLKQNRGEENNIRRAHTSTRLLKYIYIYILGFALLL